MRSDRSGGARAATAADPPTRAPQAAAEFEWLVLDDLPEGERARRAIVARVARDLRLPLSDARAVIEAGLPLPRRFEPVDAARMAPEFEALGVSVRFIAAPAAGVSCASHSALDGDEPCAACGVPTCSVCRVRHGASRCASCTTRQARSRTYLALRVGLLSAILVVVLAYAWRDIERRRARTDWRRTLNVALVLLRRGAVPDANFAALRARVPALGDLLVAEARRHRSDAVAPFAFSVYGPVDVADAPPAPDGDGLDDLAMQAWASWRYLSRVDGEAGVERSGFDARIYLVASPARDVRQTFVEGYGEQGGRVGVVAVELEDSMVDAALFVATHELFHTLGAQDKYEPGGDVVFPAGLAEPELSPRLPQRYVEVMARQRPIAPGTFEPLDALDEMRVGAVTAREIGWLR